jgi:uncharacterized protein (TIGR02145 family)
MKQNNKIRFMLVAVLAGLSVTGYAQGKWCTDATTPYQIVEVTAPSDAGATFQWKKDGEVVSGATLASLTLPTDLAEGKYTYIRYAKRPNCPDWIASNAFTVEVLTCGDIVATDPIGKKGTIIDERDKKVYKTVKMPDGKVWMAENLNYQRNLTFNARGDQAKGVSYINTGNGVAAIGSFWCPQLSGTAGSVTTNQNTCNVYGALYTWETVMCKDGVNTTGNWVEASVESNYMPSGTPASDPKATVNNAEDGGRGICPDKFHVPTERDWVNLLDLVETPEMDSYASQTGSGWYGDIAGQLLKSAGTYVGVEKLEGLWKDNPNRGIDSFGFGTVPAGYRVYNATFSELGASGYHWSSSAGSLNAAYFRGFGYSETRVNRWLNSRAMAFSVRCVMD